MWWIRLVWWTTVTGLLVMVVSAVWQRGPERVLEDVVGWAGHLSEVWWREYRRWEGYQNQAQARGQKSNWGNKGTWN